ncbi:hypothetical protein MSG28_015800 [Choristoneura fumiferana]|uniref:Uncharacterized protein n=1 Tax=Choristoneura fumiferana TaxID=7141 RepID=A0ACC0KCS0_CHOFU|nr:hypothetical protein MSG28_015800 [Choristoneura fumiferana]
MAAKNIVVLLLASCAVHCDVVFKSIPVTVKTYENETVLLPCYIHDTDADIRVRWYKDEALIGDSRDAQLLLPLRTRMFANYSLQIDGLTAADTARYTCEVVGPCARSARIATTILLANPAVKQQCLHCCVSAWRVIRPEPWGPIKQMHAIEVQYSPTITTIPEDGFLEVRKGEYVDIGCDATGTPAPIVTWKKNGEPMALLEHRHRLKFKAEHRLLAGVFHCTANNGVGDPVTADIRVIIHDAPVVSAVRSFVHTAVGLRAALEARVEFSAPPPRSAWYRDGRSVHTDDRVLIMVQDTVHQLIFRTVRASDLGNYTFRAENELGMADVSFRLTGVPNIASFKVDPALNKATSTGYTLIWEVDSYSRIIEYNLWLRPYYGRLSTTEPDAFTTQAPANRWSKIVVPGDSTDAGNHAPVTHDYEYTIVLDEPREEAHNLTQALAAPGAGAACQPAAIFVLLSVCFAIRIGS